MTRHATIIGTGSYLPDTVMTNHDLERLVDTSDEWIFSRTGISSRHVVSEGESTSDLAARAATIAMERAGVSAADIDMLYLGTTSPDYIMPSTACITQAKLGLKCPAIDLMAACSSWIYGLQNGLLHDLDATVAGSPRPPARRCGAERRALRLPISPRE